MADDRHQRDAAGSGGGLPDRGEDFDQTSEFDPLGEKDEDAGYPGGASGGEQPARRPAPDDTAPLPADDIAPLPADETATNEPADDTAPLPTANETAALPVTPGAWSGRAEVPRPEPAAVRGAAPPEWDEAGERPSRRWWLPILVGILALLLLGVLAYGIWLIVRSNEDGTGPVTPLPSAATATSATPRPTSAVPTAGRPTANATSAAATVPMPSLVGQPEATARAALDRLGLVYRLEFRTSDRTPGTVIETEPRPGTTVPLGTQVTLVIAEAPTAPAPTATPTIRATPTPTATG